MRDKFELYCKALGVALLCWGLTRSLSILPLYFHQPKANMIIPQSMMNTAIGQQMSRDVNSTFPNMFAWISMVVFLQGIFPSLLGWYLTRSNNLFVNLCYPKRESIKADQDYNNIQLNVVKEDTRTQTQAKPQGDEKYAPPGYH